jgi:type II secretory pathway pseudopilin PulG
LRNEQGYLLIEVLIACIILSVGIVALLQSLGRAVEVARYSRNQAAALVLLENNLTRLEAELAGYDLTVPQDSMIATGDFSVASEAVDGEDPIGATKVSVRWKERGRIARCDATALLATGGVAEEWSERGEPGAEIEGSGGGGVNER